MFIYPMTYMRKGNNDSIETIEINEREQEAYQ